MHNLLFWEAFSHSEILVQRLFINMYHVPSTASELNNHERASNISYTYI